MRVFYTWCVVLDTFSLLCLINFDLRYFVWLASVQTLSVMRVMFYPHTYHIFDKKWREIFSPESLSSFSSAPISFIWFQSKLSKISAFTYAILEILNAMDRPIVHCPIRSHIASTVSLNSKMKTSSTTNIVNIA